MEQSSVTLQMNLNEDINNQGWNYRLVTDGVIIYFSFIEYRFVSTFL